MPEPSSLPNIVVPGDDFLEPQSLGLGSTFEQYKQISDRDLINRLADPNEAFSVRLEIANILSSKSINNSEASELLELSQILNIGQVRASNKQGSQEQTHLDSAENIFTAKLAALALQETICSNMQIQGMASLGFIRNRNKLTNNLVLWEVANIISMKLSPESTIFSFISNEALSNVGNSELIRSYLHSISGRNLPWGFDFLIKTFTNFYGKAIMPQMNFRGAVDINIPRMERDLSGKPISQDRPLQEDYVARCYEIAFMALQSIGIYRPQSDEQGQKIRDSFVQRLASLYKERPIWQPNQVQIPHADYVYKSLVGLANPVFKPEQEGEARIYFRLLQMLDIDFSYKLLHEKEEKLVNPTIQVNSCILQQNKKILEILRLDPEDLYRRFIGLQTAREAL